MIGAAWYGPDLVDFGRGHTEATPSWRDPW